MNYGDKILDLGCGRGYDIMKAAKIVGENGMAVGFDITAAMLDVAREAAEKSNLTNVRFVQGDLEVLPFDDNYFDVIISNCAINHADDKEKVYNEIYRILKVGGNFVISDAMTKIPLPDSIKNDPEAVAQCFGGAITENEYLSCISSAGFSNINILNRREYIKNNYDFVSLTIKAVKQ